MVNPRILIQADDLTGANDTAVQFMKYGLKSLVVTGIVPMESNYFKDYEAIAINTNSRSLCPDDAYRATRNVIEALEVSKNGFSVYKKVDSMLRGNPGQELAAVMDALDIPLALVAPSFPANRSVLENGRLPSGVDAVRIFAAGSGRSTANIPLGTIRRGVNSVVAFIHNGMRQGTQVFVADAVDDTDLETIYAASSGLGVSHLLAGSAGLANQVARNRREEEGINYELRITNYEISIENKINKCITFTKWKQLRNTHLVIAGSRQPETAAQILALSQNLSIPVIRFSISLEKKKP